MRPVWQFLDPRMNEEHLGLLTEMLNDNDPSPAKEQFNRGYGHGGGWRPFTGFELSENNNLLYPGDPPVRPLAVTHLRDELIVLYSHSWVGIIQPDRSFEVCRMD